MRGRGFESGHPHKLGSLAGHGKEAPVKVLLKADGHSEVGGAPLLMQSAPRVLLYMWRVLRESTFFFCFFSRRHSLRKAPENLRLNRGPGWF